MRHRGRAPWPGARSEAAIAAPAAHLRARCARRQAGRAPEGQADTARPSGRYAAARPPGVAAAARGDCSAVARARGVPGHGGPRGRRQGALRRLRGDVRGVEAAPRAGLRCAFCQRCQRELLAWHRGGGCARRHSWSTITTCSTPTEGSWRRCIRSTRC